MKKNLSIRLDEKDYKTLEINSKAFEKNKNELIRELIRKADIDDIKAFNENLKEVLILKRSISNNLNQLAKQGHDVKNFKEVEKELEKLWQSLKQ